VPSRWTNASVLRPLGPAVAGNEAVAAVTRALIARREARVLRRLRGTANLPFGSRGGNGREAGLGGPGPGCSQSPGPRSGGFVSAGGVLRGRAAAAGQQDGCRGGARRGIAAVHHVEQPTGDVGAEAEDVVAHGGQVRVREPTQLGVVPGDQADVL